MNPDHFTTMPATRRSTRGAAAKGSSKQQSTISFNNNKVTKKGAARSTAKELAAHHPPVPTPPASYEPTEPVDEVRVEEKLQATSLDERERHRPESEVRAADVTDSQIERYWKGAEAVRIAKRVHQEDLSLAEKVLRYFDISSQYGPCIGIPRTKRWHRAEKLGLNPPIEVLAVLLKEEKQDQADVQKSAMDRIMGSTAIGAV